MKIGANDLTNSEDELINYVVAVEVLGKEVYTEVPAYWFERLQNEMFDTPKDNWQAIVYKLGLMTLLAIRESHEDENLLEIRICKAIELLEGEGFTVDAHLSLKDK